MKLWIDAQFSPAIAAWINRTFDNIEAQSVRAVGLRDSSDREIFNQARKANVVVMTKDDDFLQLIDRFGTPPQVIWITSGNTSNQQMREILSKTLVQAKKLIEKGEDIVEIGG